MQQFMSSCLQKSKQNLVLPLLLCVILFTSELWSESVVACNSSLVLEKCLTKNELRVITEQVLTSESNCTKGVLFLICKQKLINIISVVLHRFSLSTFYVVLFQIGWVDWLQNLHFTAVKECFKILLGILKKKLKLLVISCTNRLNAYSVRLITQLHCRILTVNPLIICLPVFSFVI